MKVIGRDNQVKNGFLHFPAFLQTLLGELTDEAIAKAIPDEKIKKIKRVIPIKLLLNCLKSRQRE